MKGKDEDGPLAAEVGLRDQTKASFDNYLKMAISQSKSGETKPHKKKKKSKQETDQVLENLKKGVGLRKDEEDQAILNNTFDPDDVKGEKSNKRRERQMKQRTGIENEGFENDPQDKPVKKKRKPKPANHEEMNGEAKVENDEGEKIITESNTRLLDFAEKSEEAPAEKQVQKKKKKKKRPPAEEIEMSDQHLLSDEGAAEENLDATTREYKEQLAETETPEELQVKKKRKKKKKQLPEESEERIDARPDAAERDEGEVERPLVDDGRILGVTIHRTDKLKTDFFIAQPSVMVHVMDSETGTYIKKLDKSKAVTAYYEQENKNVDFILPIMTQPFDFKKRKSTLPVWEELLLFNENVHYFTRPERNVILLFELLDMYSMNRAGVQYASTKQDSGYYHIAWAFLKLYGANGKPNTDRKVRLQLFMPPANIKAKSGEVLVYQYWKSGQRIPYSSTLYITAKGIIPPERINPGPRSMFALQEEKGRATFDDLQRTSDQIAGTSAEGVSRRNPSMWNRLPGQVCKVPNCLMLCLPSARKGCFMVKFSHDGLCLACCCHDKDGYPIILYEIPSGRVKARLLGHYGIIYEMDWSKNDKMLLSASSDGTARIWNMETYSNTPEKVMPHPSFVYSAKFHVKINKIVVTGGYDRTVRVWSLHGDSTTAQLMQELDGHMSYVNSLCFDTDGAKLFSADSLGVLRIWNVYVTEQPSKRGFLREWTLNKEHCDEELKNVAINCLQIHPNGRRLLVHSRDNTLRTLDLRVLAVSQRYMGALNFREQILSRITPCGSFVVSGSEDGAAYVWNFETGDQVARYAELNYHHPLTGVDFHPYDNMIAFCSFGENEPVLIYRYNHKVAQLDAGLESEDYNLTKKTGRPGSPELNPKAAATAQQQSDLMDGTSNLTEKLNAQKSLRMDRVQRKLDSVLAFQSLPTPGRRDHPLAVPSQAASPVPPTVGMSTWGSTFDGTSLQATPRIIQTTPQQLVAQQQYMKQSTSGWRPGFSSVGKRGTLHQYGRTRPPEMTFSMDGKPSFMVQEPTVKASSTSEVVVALYDYSAQRSDEISFTKNDVVSVIFKDNENWWLGRLENGREGFFPANYVAEAGSPEIDSHDDYARALQQEQEELDEVDHHPSTVTAVKTRSGDLKFYSGAEESDIETPGKRTGRKKKKYPEIETSDRPIPRSRKKKSTHTEESNA